MKIHNENCCNLPKRPNRTGASCYNDVTCGQKKYDNAHISRWHKENMRCDKNVKESTFDFGREQHLPPWLCCKKSCVFCEPCQSKVIEFHCGVILKIGLNGLNNNNLHFFTD